jgi:3-oxo-5alpha-steroid 4-dehydrogenase
MPVGRDEFRGASEQFNDGSLAIAQPLVVDDVNAVAWQAQCDVLVVGFGAAGASTAAAAKRDGADVLIVDRFDGGGASARSGGIYYAGGGTHYQRALGFEDTPDAMFRYLRTEVGDAVSDDTLRAFCADSVGLVDWLDSIGASFESSAPPPKTSYPKDGVYIYFSGNEALDDNAKIAPPAPRGHRMRDRGLSGRAFYEVLRRHVLGLGIPFKPQCAVRRLVTDARTGAVLGAEISQLEPGSAASRRHRRLSRWAEALHNVAPGLADRMRAKLAIIEERDAKKLLVRARRGVVLTTGGFIFNRHMVSQHAPKYLATMRLGTTGCDGSGIRLGQSVGGDWGRLDKVSAWRFINPPYNWPKGLIVNGEGQRFCNEQAYGARIGVQMCENHQGRAWLIVDRKLRRAAMREALFGGLWAFQKYPAIFLMLFAPRAGSAEALADRIDVPAGALRATIDAYNAVARGETADPFCKSKAMLQPLDAPFYALNISAGNPTFPCPAITLGGLRVSEKTGAVLNRTGQPIAGLYAAGRAAIGVASNNYVSGLSLADCIWSGRRAGNNAAAAGASRVVPFPQKS